MKNVKLILCVLFGCTVATGLRAQAYLEDPRYGNSPEERKENVLILNYFNDAYSAKMYDNAAVHLHVLLERAPRASENLYINGSNIYKTRITQATSLAEKNVNIDTLMMIYDKRAEAFADHATRGRAYVLSNKAKDYLAYRPTDRETIYQYFNDAINAAEGKDGELIDTYYSILVDDYKQDMIETDEILSEYERLAAIFEANISDPKMEEGKKVLDALLISSGAANCENLEDLFRPQYEADPNNVELMTKIVNMMARGNCDSDFQLMVAENLYKVEQNPETGLALAAIFEAKGDYERSLFYWQEAINNAKDSESKGTYLMRAASSALGASNYREAAQFARQAIEVNSENGLAYLILGQAYAGGTSQCSDFNRQTAYWLVVDNLSRARSLVDDPAQIETINRQIGQYSASFPSNEEIFFRSLNRGEGYTVNCGWVSGRTTIRTRD